MVLKSNASAQVIDSDTTAVKLFGKNFKWLGEDRITYWKIYQSHTTLGPLEKIVYLGAIIVSYTGFFRVIESY